MERTTLVEVVVRDRQQADEDQRINHVQDAEIACVATAEKGNRGRHQRDREAGVRELLHLEWNRRDDERKHTELVKTLTQYLQHGGGYEATSRALSVHRSTLKYRLQRIRELTGFDLGDPETHFNLQLATRAWLTLQALRD